MHEVGIMQRALEIAFERASEHGANRIHRIGLRVGALSGVVPDSLDFAFEALKRNTPAANACLEVEYVPLRLRCVLCDYVFEPEEFRFVCPHCDGGTEVIQGRELDVTCVEVSISVVGDR